EPVDLPREALPARDALPEQEVAREGRRLRERLTPLVQPAEKKDTILGAGDLIGDVAAVDLRDDEGRAVAAKGAPGPGVGQGHRLGSRRQVQLDAARDGGDVRSVGVADETDRLLCLQAARNRRRERGGEGVSLLAARLGAEELPARGRFDAVDEQAGALGGPPPPRDVAPATPSAAGGRPRRGGDPGRRP